MLYEVNLIFGSGYPAASDILKTIIIDAGVALKDIYESEEGKTRKISFYSNSGRKASSVKRILESLKLKKVKIKIREITNDNWKVKWKENYKPFNITENLRVTPISYKNKADPGKNNIIIDTDIIFGSGLHSTTRSMVGLIEKAKGRFISFLDIGTGTGILAIAAHKLGAKDIYCIDSNPEAVKAARKNLKINKCLPAIIKNIDLTDFRVKRKFDFVAANLLTKDLMEKRMKIVSLVGSGKYLSVSGVLLENFKEFRMEFFSKELKCLKILKREGWAAVLFKKTV